MEVKGKVAIVSGGTGGIGFVTVETLLKHGAQFVAIFDLKSTETRAASCVEKLEKEFGRGRAAFYPCDVSDANNFKELYDKVVHAQRSVDILVNNAGVLNDRQVDLTIDINLKSVIKCTLHAIDRMGKHKGGKGGTIVNVASVAGLVLAPMCPVYSATKTGIVAFTRCLKEQYGHTKVRVAAVCPGPTETHMLGTDLDEALLEIIKFDMSKFMEANKDLVQSPECVATAIVRLIEEAEPGAVWVSEESKQPYAVADPPHYKNRRVYQTID